MSESVRPLGVGVVGLNWGAGRLATMKQTAGLRLVGVCAQSEATATRVAAQHAVDWYTDYQALLRRDDLDIVAVYTPSAVHREVVLAAAAAGKHVVVTKPLETTLARIDEVVTACARAGVVLATEYVTRYAGAYHAAHQALASGALGRPLTGEFSYKCYRPADYYQGTRGTWAVDGGGALMMQAIHVVDVMGWFFGPAREVYARCSRQVHALEAEDTALAIVTFANGAVATLVGTTTFHNTRPAGNYGGGTIIRVEVGASDGAFIMSDGAFQMWKCGAATEPPAATRPVALVYEDLVRLLRGEQASSMLVTGAAARQSVALVLAAYESALTGRPVVLD